MLPLDTTYLSLIDKTFSLIIIIIIINQYYVGFIFSVQ